MHGPGIEAVVGLDELLPSDSGVTLHGTLFGAFPVPEPSSADAQPVPGSRALATTSTSTYIPLDLSPVEQEIKPGTRLGAFHSNGVEPQTGSNSTQPLEPQYGPSTNDGSDGSGGEITQGGGGGGTMSLTGGNPEPVELEAIDWTAAEGGGTAAFQLRRSSGIETEQSFRFLVSGSATNLVDYTLSGEGVDASTPGEAKITLSEGQDLANIMVQVIDDNDYEGPEAVTLTPYDGFLQITGKSVTVSINDDPALSRTATSIPAFSVTAVADSNGAGTNGAFALTRQGGNLGEDLIVDYSVGGTAIPGTDYELLYGQAYFKAGQQTTGVLVEGLSAPLGAKTLTLGRVSIVDGSPSTTAGPGFGVISITDGSDDAGRAGIVRVQASRATATEGGLPGEFTFSRLGADLSGTLSVGYTISGTAGSGSDYTWEGSATFKAFASTVTVFVKAVEDYITEVPETVEVNLVSGSHTLVDPTRSSATVTIEEAAGSVGGDSYAYAGSTGVGSGNSSYAGDSDPSSPPVIYPSYNLSSSDGCGSGSLSSPIPKNDLGHTDIDTIGHIYVQENDNFGNSCTSTAMGIEDAPDHGIATIHDEHIDYTPNPGFRGIDTFVYYLDNGVGTGTATVTVHVGCGSGLGSGSGGSPLAVDDKATTQSNTFVDIPVMDNDTFDACDDPSLSIYTPAQHGTATVNGLTIGYQPQTGFQGTDTFVYQLSNAYGSDTATVTITVEGQVVSIVRNADAYEENIVPGSVTIARSQSNGPLTVYFDRSLSTADDPWDYSLSQSSPISFADGQTSVSVIVYPIDDSVVEIDDEEVHFQLQSGTGYAIDPLYASTAVTIHDNDAKVWVSYGSDAKELGEVAGHFTIHRNYADQPASVHYSLTGQATTADYSTPGKSSDSILFLAGEYSHTLPIVPIDDGLPEIDETVIASVWAEKYQTIHGPATLTIEDSSPEVWITAAHYADELITVAGQFVVHREANKTADDLTVSYTLSGTAIQGTDYRPVSGSVTILAGYASASFTVDPIDDSLPEETETIIGSLAAGPYKVTGTSATVHLFDNDDQVTVEWVKDAYEKGTKNGQFRFTRLTTSKALPVPYTFYGQAQEVYDYSSPA